MSLVTTDWVLENLNSLKIIDATWHMPAQKRNPAEEYLNAHIPNSVFFDLDENSEKKYRPSTYASKTRSLGKNHVLLRNK